MLFSRFIVLALVALASVAARAESEALVIKRPAQLRQAPGEASAALTPLAVQTPVTRMEARQGAWIQVKLASGQVGWVHMFDVGTNAAPSSVASTATGALRGLTNLFGGGSSQNRTTTATSTIGIRGLGAEDIANAQPNMAALSKVEGMRVDSTQARRFAADATLVARAVEPLPIPNAPTAAATSPAPEKERGK